MKAKYISYQDTLSFPKLVIDYINDDEKLNNFYDYRPDFEGLEKAINQHKFSGNRNVLVDVLKKQYQHIKTHQAVANNINLLLKKNTYTVTTGHQLNLFTGPLYFIYKIVTAINLALELKIKHPEKNFVPIYWMATEDHDFEEINHVNIEDGNISWIQQSNGATGRLSTKNVSAAVQAYKAYLGINQNAKKLGKIIEEAYINHDNLADATRYLTNHLFEQYGLVIIDADDKNLKSLYSNIIQEDITKQKSEELCKKTTAKLLKMNYKAQVNGRNINFFYLKDNIRERIEFDGEFYQILNTDIRFAETELLSEIQQYPERFSPNVIMRPVYQELILPNLAYIGGGAEVSYWMQLKAIFNHYKLSFPVLLLRNSALIIDKRSSQIINQLRLDYKDIFLPLAELQKNWIKNNEEIYTSLQDEKLAIKSIFDRIKLNAFKIDKTLEASTAAAFAKTKNQIDKLETKLIKADKRKHKTSLTQIENLKKRLFPNGVLQERVYNIAPMYVNFGDDFISSLIEGFEPLGGDFTIVISTS